MRDRSPPPPATPRSAEPTYYTADGAPFDGGLNKPGPRYASDASLQDRREVARGDYVQRTCDAWRGGGDAPGDVGDAAAEYANYVARMERAWERGTPLPPVRRDKRDANPSDDVI
jgi:hypothetical protein